MIFQTRRITSPLGRERVSLQIGQAAQVEQVRHWSAAYAHVEPNVRFTYKRRADAPATLHPSQPLPPVSTYYEDTTFCDAVQLSPEPPPLPRGAQPHHHRPVGTDVQTRCRGASLCLLLPPSRPRSPDRLSIRSFIRKNTHLDRRPDRASVNAAPNRANPEVLDKPKGA